MATPEQQTQAKGVSTFVTDSARSSSSSRNLLKLSPEVTLLMNVDSPSGKRLTYATTIRTASSKDVQALSGEAGGALEDM